MPFHQKLLCKIQSAILITVSVVATSGCLALGTLAATRSADWCRGVKAGTTFKDVKSFITNPEICNILAAIVGTYAANSFESQSRV